MGSQPVTNIGTDDLVVSTTPPRMMGLVTMLRTRYNWLVDRQPTQTRYTSLGNVSRSIKVSMEFESTLAAKELRAIAVPFVNMTTNRTLLRSEPGINKDNLLSEILCFIPDKFFQLVERPGVQFPIKLLPSSFLHTDLCKILKCEYSKWRLSNLLRDTMINISHKPSLSTRHSEEFPLCRSSAFGLDLSSEMDVFTTDILHSRRIKEFIVGTNCNVYNTPVYSKNRLFQNYLRGISFKLAMQVKRVIVLTQRQGRRFNFPQQILLVILWNAECDLNSAIRGGKGSILGIKTHPDNSGVVSHCRKLFTERLMFTLHRFQRFTSTISCALNQRGGEIRNRLSDILIRGIMAAHLVKGVGIEPPFSAGIESHSVISHGFQERFPSIRRNIKFQLNCPNHNHILVGLEYILNEG